MTDRILHKLIYLLHIKQDKNLVQHTLLAVQGAEALPLSLELISVVALSGVAVGRDPRVDLWCEFDLLLLLEVKGGQIGKFG